MSDTISPGSHPQSERGYHAGRNTRGPVHRRRGCVMCFVCMTEIIGNKPTKGRGSAQEPWEHRWGGVPPAESQGAFREEVGM